MDVATNIAYPTPYATSPLLPLLLLSLAKQRYTPITKTTFQKEYDFIIVGAGSAGSVLASRLSEVPCARILVLEAGKTPPILTEVPALARNFWFSDIDWTYKTVPQKNSGKALVNNQVIWPSGKAVGGSSVMNAMVYVRGNKKNYDDWAKQGAVGWSSSDVWPYFLKLEDNRDPEYLANGYHVVDGPISVEKPPYLAEFKAPIFDAANQLGFKVVDPNGNIQTGFYDNQATIRHAQRCSAAKGYLVPAENRTNLDILPNAFVRKVLFNGKRAVGVEFDFKGQKNTVTAKREVILSAGTTNTAQLLMLSGVGRKEHLQKLKIPLVEDLPVGDNFHDHDAAPMLFQVDSKIPNLVAKISNDASIKQYIDNRTGPLASAEGISAISYLNNANPNEDFPINMFFFAEVPIEILKYQLGIKPEVYKALFTLYENATLAVCLAQNNQPKSRGTVRLNSTDPHDPPLIDPNYYDQPEDIKNIVLGLKTCLAIITSPAMQKFGAKLLTTQIPDCAQYATDQDKLLECLARHVTMSLSHQVGTAKMGNPSDPTTAVDSRLKVKNLEGLRVVDASVMPTAPFANTNIPTIMVAEKAADIIKDTLDCKTQIPFPFPSY